MIIDILQTVCLTILFAVVWYLLYQQRMGTALICKLTDDSMKASLAITKLINRK